MRTSLSFMVVGLTALFGCADASLIGGVCDDDQGCDVGEVCAFGLCVDAGALGAVDLDVEPVAGSQIPAQTVLGVALDGGRADVDLRAAVLVEGTVTAVDGQPVAATVTAQPEVAIAGRRRQPSIVTQDGAFGLSLVRGAAYRLQAVPLDRTLPPIVGVAAFEAGTTAIPSLELTTTRDEQGRVTAYPVSVRGRIVAGVGVAEQGIPDLEVLLADDGGKRLSSLAVTGLDGSFTVGLAAQVTGTTFVVRPSDRNTQFPTVSFPLDLGSSDVVDVGNVSLGSVTSPVPVSGIVRASSGAPARRAVVLFRGLIGAGIVSARTTTGDDGRFSVALHLGTYSVAGVGDVAESAGTLLLDLEVSGPVGDLAFTLPERVSLDLDVQTAEGLGVGLASVVAVRVGDENGLAEPVLADAQPTFLASADEAGRVSLLVDVGRYRVTVEPPRGSGAPAFSALFTLTASEQRAIVLPAATVVAGSLRDATEAPAVGAFVRVFSTITDELGRAIFLGEAQTDSDGAFTAFVPSLL